MNYSVVFSSQTGNTELVAKRIRRDLGEQVCVYFGAPANAGDEARSADVVFVGSWTDKGTASPDVIAFLGTLDHARVFLFGTCGYGESEGYFNTVLSRIREELPDNCEVVGSFMCQGKMPETVLDRYRAMLVTAEPASAEAKRAELFIKNFEAARPHPNSDDLRALDAALREASLS